MCPEPNPPKEKERRVAITVRISPELDAALTKAIELGYFKSKNEAAVTALERLLRSIFFVSKAIHAAEEKVRSTPQNSKIPRELLLLQYALKILDELPDAQDFWADFNSLASMSLAFYRGKGKEFEEFVQALENLFKVKSHEE